MAILSKKHGRLRKWLVVCLEEKGEATTGEIYDFVNDKLRYGVTMNQLGNFLARDPRIEKLGLMERYRFDTIRVRHQIWKLKTEHGRFERTC